MQTFILPGSRKSLNLFLDRLPTGKSWAVSVAPHVKRRTLQQNALLWGVVYPQVALFFGGGVTKDDVHNALGDLFLPTEINPIDGREYRQSTARLGREQLSDYIEQICAWAAGEHGFHIEIGESKATTG